jgi:type VI secretion system protein ImpE
MNTFVARDLAQEAERINAAIRAQPLEASHRQALARLCLLRKEYPRALKQLQLACQFDADLEPEAQLSRMLVCAEQTREAVFAGKILPDLLAPASGWFENMIQALREPPEKAAAIRRDALAEAPPSAGHWGESSSFEWLADGDERLGPVFELILGGVYYWVPFDAVESLRVPTPGSAMDLVWTPVELKLTGQDARIAYMPSRYIPEEQGEESLLSGAETVWQESPEGIWIGQGRRVWYADGEPFGMFEAGLIAFER